MLWRLFVWNFEIMPWSISSIILGMVSLGDWDADIVDGDSRRLFLCRVLWVWVTFTVWCFSKCQLPTNVLTITENC